MDPLTLAAVMGAAGLAKSELIDRPREERQRKQAAITARWSPWTGMAPNAIREADPFGSAIQGGLAGAMIGQATQGADAAKTKDVAEVSLAGGKGISQTGPYLTAQEYPVIQQEQPLALEPMQQMQQNVATVSQYPFPSYPGAQQSPWPMFTQTRVNK